MERYTGGEKNTQKQGKSGSKVKVIPGPAKGRAKGRKGKKVNLSK